MRISLKQQNLGFQINLLNSVRSDFNEVVVYVIDRDYPAEILNARKQLWPRFKELKQTKRVRDTITIRYPAQLVKNREVIEDA